MTNKATSTDIHEIVKTEDSIGRTQVGIDMNKIIGEVISEVT